MVSSQCCKKQKELLVAPEEAERPGLCALWSCQIMNGWKARCSGKQTKILLRMGGKGVSNSPRLCVESSEKESLFFLKIKVFYFMM